jgi:hypothetical protein
MTRQTRLGLIGAAVVVVVVAIVIASSGGKSKSSSNGRTTAAPTVAHIVVRNAKPVGGVKTIKVKKGRPVRFDVTSDTADEIHVHGYDYHKDVAKGGRVAFDFPAKIDGVFVIELEKHAEQIASLEVTP